MLFIIIASLGLLSYLTFTYIIYPAFLSPLSKIPNAHFTSGFSDVWMRWNRYRGQTNRAIHDAHKRLGPIIRLGLTEIHVNSAEALKVVYNDNFEKDPFYLNFANYDQPNMFSMINRQAHSKRRRMVANIYSNSSLQSSPVIKQLSKAIFMERLLPIIDEAAKTGTPINMLDYSSAVYSDFTSAFVFGLQNGSDFVRDKPARDHWLETKKIMMKGASFWSAEFPSFTSWLGKFGVEFDHPKMGEVLEETSGLYLNMLERLEKSESRELKEQKSTEPVVYRQLLSQLQLSDEKSSAARLPESQLRLTVASELMDHLLAGTETSSWTLTYLMHELSKRPELQASLRKELLSLSPPIVYNCSAIEDLPSARAIEALPLLDAILFETLRVHPSVPGSQARRTPQPSSSILGYNDIPGGIRVSAQCYSLHRNPEVFPDPESWKPSRWIETTAEKKAEMMRWFWVFGSGGNMCIGNHLAILELKLAVTAIYTNYTTSIIDDEDFETLDGYVRGPKGEKMIVQFSLAE